MRESLLAAMLFMCFLHYGSSQSVEGFRGGIKAGINTSQMTGDGYIGFYKFSPVFGAFASHGLSEKMRFQYELLYQNKGSRDPAIPDQGKYNSYKIVLNYIEVPLIWQFRLKKFTLEAGPSIGMLVGSEEEDENGPVKGATYDWRSVQMDGLVGASYDINENLYFNIRGQHSITSIVHSTVINRYGVYGGAWNITIAASFNYRF